MYRACITIFTAGLIIGAGWFHGRIVDRWGDSHEMNQAVARLQNLKTSFGDWTSQPIEINPRHLEVAEVTGYIQRLYVNRTSGERISILLICGRPGPIAVHSPDVCYQGAGYKMGPKSIQTLAATATSRPLEFWAARFAKDQDPTSLHILWSWSDGGRWIAPDNPRLVFYRSKVLYKLYIVHETKSHDGPVVDEAIQSFVIDFFPALQQMMSDNSATPPS